MSIARESLRIHGLSCRFGAVTAVDEIDLDVPAGQMLAVIGRSGAGKSTLLRMINRLQEPSTGSIAYGPTDVTALRGRALRDWRRDCAMIFQQFNLIGRADVLTNVLIGRLNHRPWLPSLLGLFTEAERAMAVQALDRFGLLDIALQRADTLSGGQQQRVALCRALLQEPRMLLADEPIASLDPHNARLVMDALRQINREDGLTILANLHHLDTARAYCDRVVALDRGRIVFDDIPDRLTPDVIMAIYNITEQEFHAADTPVAEPMRQIQ
ncbi:MAG: phosphonate ABC transporter ATP-binding protein [Acetobacteraceae bacterium]|nr:phosphonate ABC transporter ATP-binding protein [Acetobacteraceae bacterium]MSP30738.1 phosphonate ABC transporter ATP-binding protein [Acetobacteraceae bacterium]